MKKSNRGPQGRTAVFACKADPRFSFSLYVPKIVDGAPTNLLVSIHGSARDQHNFREVFVDFADASNTVVLAPLFPIGVSGDDNGNGYKYLRENSICYDDILLAMVVQVEQMLSLSFPKFMLFGFSGGGHFAHRFFFLHPERLKAVSISAPGSVTLLDDTKRWWVGIADVEDETGHTVDVAKLKGVPVHLSIGLDDIKTSEITHDTKSPSYIEGANSAGKTRIERNDSLRASLEEHGISVFQDRVPNVGHNLFGLVPATISFLTSQLH